MFLILILHVLGQGGVLNNAKDLNYSLAWLQEIGAYCAVNCFGLISGFVGYTEQERRYRYRKYILFWLQVFIYNFGITFIFYLFRLPSQEPVSLKTLLKSGFPVLTGYYWYFRAYTGLFFVIPWLNKLLRNLSKKECTMLAITLFLLAVFGTIKDTFEMNGGKSFAWLVFLYVIGAWIKINKIYNKMKPVMWILIFFGCIILTWLWKIFSPVIPEKLINNISPTMLLASVCCICFFCTLSFNEKCQKLIRFFAPSAFGVYLIHLHFVIWDYYFCGSFAWIASSSPWILIPLVLGCSLGIFLVCLLIDVIRLRLFILLRVDRAVDKLANSLANIFKEIFC